MRLFSKVDFLFCFSIRVNKTHVWPTHFWLFNQRFYFHLTKAIIKQFNISPATRTYKSEQFSLFVVKPVINLSFRRERPKRLSLLYTAINCTKPQSGTYLWKSNLKYHYLPLLPKINIFINFETYHYQSQFGMQAH